MGDAYTEWVPDHFIGGHPALDLSNAVFDRRAPAADNELFKSVRDVANWFNASGLADDRQAQAVAEIADGRFVERVREVREASFQIFESIAAGKPSAEEPLDHVTVSRERRAALTLCFDAIPDGKPLHTFPGIALGVLFSRTASSLAAGSIELDGTRPKLALARWRDPDAVTALLAMLSIEAFFTLPRDRLHSCPRCGWLFLDTSRGGKRRWCSMRTCGNREKVSRHRDHAHA
ncbi:MULTISPECIES: CGNR zinc finger domain-containing protein [unclassified Mesorhizobium]|uniref:CGNR zinc finger domain-containing protein n=2 Tax=Mesorhizobium TaxID=68287 RepID=UPI000FCB8F77|nr:MULTISPECIES: CGNR zinc finger domain-containing protein [unclassified Mesorhizobium]RUU65482.1 zf-CGNR multi-domain protein [Mesorhizobium sp. M7A.T.Ca.TU.009.01.1.1]RUU82720.1 zf-CGNR multi-domain protein [Mesorhizobium sp. M7A.T.Ca.TU.009.01.1.2]RUV49861.1 zf-CGNR multi-domain protein [Mesorhizobium sp. M7A.F.Ca.MR.228.00.0.0]RUT86510.1 zf-CGNR multi-domain protein [Mesorhizobium sp. M7A.T.Ca.US.000.02.1.1]RUT91706.1 zf-CGNR multi-domain protein [Mesorhizobium sp. M7A.T.Ca.US.000.02.2.1]